MIEVVRHRIGTIDIEKLAFAVICARYADEWLFVRHRERVTWEVPGGHREPGETIEQAAARELVEETGAETFLLAPVCDYSVQCDEQQPTFGRLFIARVGRLGALPASEIADVIRLSRMPEQLTYPRIQSFLFRWTEEFLAANDFGSIPGADILTLSRE